MFVPLKTQAGFSGSHPCGAGFGVSISYLIVIGGLMPKVVHSFRPDLVDSVLLDRRLWILASMTLLCPLAFLRRLDSLKVTSYIALCAIGYLVFIVVYYSFSSHPELPPPGDVQLFRFGPSFIQVISIQTFAFTCAQNIFAVCVTFARAVFPKGFR